MDKQENTQKPTAQQIAEQVVALIQSLQQETSSEKHPAFQQLMTLLKQWSEATQLENQQIVQQVAQQATQKTIDDANAHFIPIKQQMDNELIHAVQQLSVAEAEDLREYRVIVPSSSSSSSSSYRDQPKQVRTDAKRNTSARFPRPRMDDSELEDRHRACYARYHKHSVQQLQVKISNTMKKIRNNEQIYHTLARQVPLQLMDLECLKRLVADREKQTKEKEEAQRKRDLLKIQQMELKQQEQQLRLQEQQQQLQSSYAYLENKTVSSGLLK